MPQTKDYNGKKKMPNGKSEKRRPHSEMPETPEAVAAEEAELVEGEASTASGVQSASSAEEPEINTEAQNEGVAPESGRTQHSQAEAQGKSEQEKARLNFKGSDVIREKAPKVMEFADTVVDEWMKDGEFEGLPVGHPLAQVAAAKALRTAKDVEKKLEEKGVLAMARMGFDFVKSKIEKRSNH